jgi:diaminohydroxyphosphoribosylaminopyrimidine deaminase / 5-amino-6-(5-phosphoribosylamino)uracil reductase
MSTADHAFWMRRCLQLARNGAGHVAPNPLVGAVLVQDGRVLAEGWHAYYGGAHAEVACLREFGDGPVPADAVLYVDLEPCAHQGKTPPCADLLIARGVRHVVIGSHDPFPAVAGKGIERLRAAGVTVTTGILEDECHWQQRRFLTSVEQGRPYVVLKWARSLDGLLDRHPREGRRVQRISNAATTTLVHRWRAEEQAILVGSRTVLNDDPQLTVRLVQGRDPLRVVLDRAGITPAASRVYDGSAPTLLFTGTRRNDLPHVEQVLLNGDDPLRDVLHELHQRSIRSLLVEGGARLLNTFLEQSVWDEARVITGRHTFGSGTPAPAMPLPARSMELAGDHIDLYMNTTAGHAPPPLPEWPL